MLKKTVFFLCGLSYDHRKIMMQRQTRLNGSLPSSAQLHAVLVTGYWLFIEHCVSTSKSLEVEEEGATQMLNAFFQSDRQITTHTL
jgi:hypothetical protein